MSGVDLADFLLARIAEDEKAARAATQGRWRVASGDDRYITVMADDPTAAPVLDGWAECASDWGLAADEADLAHIARWDPARVLAECKAKRRIVEAWEEHEGWASGRSGALALSLLGEERFEAEGEVLARNLQLLALPYTDHPDYREEWRP